MEPDERVIVAVGTLVHTRSRSSATSLDTQIEACARLRPGGNRSNSWYTHPTVSSVRGQPCRLFEDRVYWVMLIQRVSNARLPLTPHYVECSRRLQVLEGGVRSEGPEVRVQCERTYPHRSTRSNDVQYSVAATFSSHMPTTFSRAQSRYRNTIIHVNENLHSVERRRLQLVPHTRSNSNDPVANIQTSSTSERSPVPCCR